MGKLRLTMFIGMFSVGGGQQMVYELIRKLDRSKIDIEVICYEGRADTRIESEIEQICTVRYLDAKGKVTIGKIKKVFNALRESKPDIVHVHLGGMVYAVPWSLLNRVPLLLTVHAKPSKAFNPTILPLIKWGIFRKKIWLSAVSKENYKLVQKYLDIYDERIVCINNGIDLDRFYSNAHSKFTFINVARQDENKNQAQIIRCFKKINKEFPNTELILVGDGPCHEALKALVSELNLLQAARFTGTVSNAEDYYAVSDVYVQASHREAMPMSVLEAMASRLPIISTDVGGLRDVVNSNGILVRDNDEESMYRAMVMMLNLSFDELDVMRRKSWENVQEYSSDNMAIQYYGTYCSMLKKRG